MTDFELAVNGAKPVLVDFYARWCGPCKMQSPILDRVRQMVGDAARIIKVDVDMYNDLAAVYNIQSIPTLILFKNGRQLWRASGVRSEADIVSKIREHI